MAKSKNAKMLYRLRQEAAAKGLCYVCRCRPAKLGKRTCQACLDAKHARSRERAAEGRCFHCARKARPGTAVCARHTKKIAARRKAWSEERKRKGLCLRPGCSLLAALDRTLCTGHLAEMAERNRDLRAERKVLGLCGRTGCDRNAEDGHTLCELHLEALRLASHARTKARGT